MAEDVSGPLWPQAKGIKRLIEGVFPFGVYVANIALKILAVHRYPSQGLDAVEITVLDHISRIESVSLFFSLLNFTDL